MSERHTSALLFSFLTGRPPPRLPSQPPDLPGKGRRTGSVERWIFQEFVWHLLLSTSEVGGEFTFAKEPLTGTLIGAIEMLAPYLPDGFVPKPLPGSTLQRLIDSCTRNKKAVEDLERDLSDDLS